jgi:hypothetical protein
MTEAAPPVQAPAWVRHAVWWYVYPIEFIGADPTVASHEWEVAF